MGFTLVELVIVLVVIGVLAVLAAPTFENIRANSVVRGAARKIYGDFNQSKADAIKTGVVHVVEYGLTVNGTVYDYVIWQDSDGDRIYDGGEEVKTILLDAEGYDGVSLNTTPANPTFFNGRGMLDNAGNGTITFQRRGYSGNLQIVISTLGKVEIQ